MSFICEHAIFATTPLYHSFVSMPSSLQQHPVAYHCWLQIAVAYPASVALWEGRRRASASSRGPSSSTWAPPSAVEASSTLTRFSLLATAFTPRESVLHSLCVCNSRLCCNCHNEQRSFEPFMCLDLFIASN